VGRRRRAGLASAVRAGAAPEGTAPRLSLRSGAVLGLTAAHRPRTGRQPPPTAAPQRLRPCRELLLDGLHLPGAGPRRPQSAWLPRSFGGGLPDTGVYWVRIR